MTTRTYHNETCTLAQRAVPNDVDHECSQVAEYLRSDHAERYLGSSSVQRAALFDLVMTPYSATSVEDACKRVAAIVQVLARMGQAGDALDYSTASELLDCAAERARREPGTEVRRAG